MNNHETKANENEGKERQKKLSRVPITHSPHAHFFVPFCGGLFVLTRTTTNAMEWN
jgi:hypothetical protein